MLYVLLLIEISPASHFSINEKTTTTKALQNTFKKKKEKSANLQKSLSRWRGQF